MRAFCRRSEMASGRRSKSAVRGLVGATLVLGIVGGSASVAHALPKGDSHESCISWALSAFPASKAEADRRNDYCDCMHDWDAPQDKEICAKRYRDAGGEDPVRGDDGGWLNPTKVTNIQLGEPVLRVPVVASSGLVTKADELSAVS